MGATRTTAPRSPGWSTTYCCSTPPPIDQPARDQVAPTGETQGLQEAVDVVDHVAESAGGVDRLLLGPPERAHVGSDDPHVVGEQVGDVAPVAPGGDVAVDEQDGAPVLGATGPHVHRETRGLDHLGDELGHLGAPSNYAGGAVLAPSARWPVGRSVTIRWRPGVSGQTFLAAATYHHRLEALLLNMRSRERSTENFDGWPVVVREPSPTPGPGGTGLFGALRGSRRSRRAGRSRPAGAPTSSIARARAASRR